MRRSPLLPLLALSLGCSPPGVTERPEPDKPSDSGSPGDSGADTASDTGGDSGDTILAFDCATVPEPPFDATRLDAPRGYNDLVFDEEGAMYGCDGGLLIQATSPDDAALFAPGVGVLYKMGMLPSGDIVATTASRTIITITPDGGHEVLVGDFDGYGLAVGSDGMVYAGTNYTTNRGEIIRVDPSTGEMTQFLDATGMAPRGLEFSADDTKLYFGTTNHGAVFALPLDEDLNPVSEPEQVVMMPMSWHDTLEVDACGNLYVGSFYGHRIMRVDSELEITELMSWNFDNYGHGFEWGSAAGGWEEQSIYVTHPYNGSWVDEIPIGVPGRQYTGEVVGGVTL